MVDYSEQIKNKISIVDLISRYMKLKNSGSGRFTALCPFHNEKTPSFTVNNIKGFYYCFGCGDGGDIFSFLMKKEGLPYKEILKKLAKEAGIALPKSSNNEEVDRYYHIYEATASFYQKQLDSNEGSVALDYLKRRSLSDAIISKFRLGYAPKDSNLLIQYLESIFVRKDIINSGIIANTTNTKSIYDRFYGRIIFPIKDKNGQVIAFGGRTLKKDNSSKYINSQETKIFKKGMSLYNLDLAYKHAYKEKDLILVEGYMDVITLSMHGIHNVVAPLGTSIKNEQIELLWQFVDEPTVCLDTDQAGINAMHRVATNIIPLVKHNKTLKFTELKNGKDPDDVISKIGKAKFLEYIDNSISLADFIFSIEYDKNALNTPERKRGFLHRLDQIATEIGDDRLQKEYKSHFFNLYWETVKKRKNYATTKSNITLPSYDNDNNHNFINMIRYILLYPQSIAELNIKERFDDIELGNEMLDKLKDFIIFIADNEDFGVQINIEEKIKHEFVPEVVELLYNHTMSCENINDAKQVILRLGDIYSLGVVQKQISDLCSLLQFKESSSDYARLQALKQYEEDLKNTIHQY